MLSPEPLRLKNMPTAERPQERLLRSGANALSDTELLALIIRSGTQKVDVLALASAMLKEAKSLSGLLSWTAYDFQRLEGIGKVKALQLLTIIELAKRILSQEKEEKPNMSSPEAVYGYFQSIVAGLEVEKFWALCLNRKNRLIKHLEVSSGTAGSSLVHAREVFREAIRLGASAVICVHNHPSGDPSPSKADFSITRRLIEAGRILEIHLVDHIIIGDDGLNTAGGRFFSFMQMGFI